MQTVFQPHCSSCFLNLLGSLARAVPMPPRFDSASVRLQLQCHLLKKISLISQESAQGPRAGHWAALAWAPNAVRFRTGWVVDVMVMFCLPSLLLVWCPDSSSSLVLGGAGWVHLLWGLHFSWALLVYLWHQGEERGWKQQERVTARLTGEAVGASTRKVCLTHVWKTFDFGRIFWIQFSVSSDAWSPINVLKISYGFSSQIFIREQFFHFFKVGFVFQVREINKKW